MKALKDKFAIKGHMLLQLFGPDGKLKETREYYNTVTELGDAHVADAMADIGEAVLGRMAIGTGNGQTASSTGLATSLSRLALTSTTQGGGAADNDVVFVGTWVAGAGTGAITEAGILRDDDNLQLNYYADFSVVNKGALDTLAITWTITFGAS